MRSILSCLILPLSGGAAALLVVSGGAMLSSCSLTAGSRWHAAARRSDPPAPRAPGLQTPVRAPEAADQRTGLIPPQKPRPPDRGPVVKPDFGSEGPLVQRLRAVVEEAVSHRVAHSVGIAVCDLASGQGYGVNPNRPFKPASVIKLAVMVAAFRVRSRLRPGQFDRLRPDLQRMITISDNPATRRLVNRLGARQVNAAIQELGLEQFRVGTSGSRDWVLMGSRATPADTALLLAKIARREAVSPEACDEMLALLGAQQKRGRIPAGLPSAPDLWVGNKTGTLNGVVNDAGIVLQPSEGIAYTLALFTAGTRSEAAGERLLADLSAVVYSFMAARHRATDQTM